MTLINRPKLLPSLTTPCLETTPDTRPSESRWPNLPKRLLQGLDIDFVIQVVDVPCKR